MTPAQQTRIRRRIHRLEQRLAWNRRLRKIWDLWQAQKHRAALAFLREIIADDPDISDEELIEQLAQRLDELLEFEGIRETISDIGIRAFAALAVNVLRRTPAWLDQRAETITARIERLKQMLAQAGEDRELEFGVGDPDARLLAELGFDPEFLVD